MNPGAGNITLTCPPNKICTSFHPKFNPFILSGCFKNREPSPSTLDIRHKVLNKRAINLCHCTVRRFNSLHILSISQIKIADTASQKYCGQADTSFWWPYTYRMNCSYSLHASSCIVVGYVRSPEPLSLLSSSGLAILPPWCNSNYQGHKSYNSGVQHEYN